MSIRAWRPRVFVCHCNWLVVVRLGSYRLSYLWQADHRSQWYPPGAGATPSDTTGVSGQSLHSNELNSCICAGRTRTLRLLVLSWVLSQFPPLQPGDAYTNLQLWNPHSSYSITQLVFDIPRQQNHRPIFRSIGLSTWGSTIVTTVVGCQSLSFGFEERY
jgi:hypothetical protein